MKKGIKIFFLCPVIILIAFGFWSAVKNKSGYKFVIVSATKAKQTYLEIYKDSKLIYRFAAVAPEEISYPRPLELEKIELAGRYLVTSWGETGADYFGTHPVVISLKENSCELAPAYSGNLSDNPSIKDYDWTNKDFFVTNYFDKSEKVKTILTQGISVSADKQLELRFYGDNEPHAADHRYVDIKVMDLK